MRSLDTPATEQFKLFEGSAVREMPVLLSGKNEKGEIVDVPRLPMSSYGFMKRYVEVLAQRLSAPMHLRHAYDALLNTLENLYLSSGDGAARHSDERMKVTPDASYLKLITLETKLVGGAVNLSEGYAALAGEEFSKADVDKHCGRPLSESDAMQNPVWMALARADRSLLGEFVRARFARAKELFNYSGNMMGILPPAVPNVGAAGRLWAVSRLLDLIYSSRAYGNLHLDDDDGRLVGVAPEAQRAARQTLERRV